MKLSYIIIGILFPFFAFSQIKSSAFISVGYMDHLYRTGLNTEIGIDWEMLKRLNASTFYRYSILDNNKPNEVEIKAISLILSYIIINKERHKLMVGTGLSYGKYKRFTSNLGFEKEYIYYWFNPIKLRYDYIFTPGIKIGLDTSFYGDDGDGSAYIGLNVGYIL